MTSHLEHAGELRPSMQDPYNHVQHQSLLELPILENGWKLFWNLGQHCSVGVMTSKPWMTLCWLKAGEKRITQVTAVFRQMKQDSQGSYKNHRLTGHIRHSLFCRHSIWNLSGIWWMSSLQKQLENSWYGRHTVVDSGYSVSIFMKDHFWIKQKVNASTFTFLISGIRILLYTL